VFPRIATLLLFLLTGILGCGGSTLGPPSDQQPYTTSGYVMAVRVGGSGSWEFIDVSTIPGGLFPYCAYGSDGYCIDGFVLNGQSYRYFSNGY